MKNKFELLLTFVLFAFVGIAVYANIAEQQAVDQSKIPERVEDSRGWQRWITNLKNKDFDIGADEFRLKEENEVYNTARMRVLSVDDQGVMEDFERIITLHKDIEDDVEFSPSERQFIDHRYLSRDGGNGTTYAQNDVHYYGLRDDKIIDSKILTCDIKANCYFDRAFFIDNDVFVITEFSRPLLRDEEIVPCGMNETCVYTFKVHVIDLINNSNLVYESEPYERIWDQTIPEL